MNELQYSISRLTAWLRDYGHEKQPPFVADLTEVLKAANALDAAERELEAIDEACNGFHLEDDDSLAGRVECLVTEWKDVCTLCGHGPIHLDYISAAESVRELIDRKDGEIKRLTDLLENAVQTIRHG